MTQIILVRTKSRGEVAFSDSALVDKLRNSTNEVLSWSFIELDPQFELIYVVETWMARDSMEFVAIVSHGVGDYDDPILDAIGYHPVKRRYWWYIKANSPENAIAKAKQLFVDSIVKGEEPK